MDTTLRELFEVQKAKMDALHKLEYKIIYERCLDKALMDTYREACKESRLAIANVIMELKKQMAQLGPGTTVFQNELSSTPSKGQNYQALIKAD